MSLSENGNFAIIVTTSGVYPKISLLPVLSQINKLLSLKSKYLIFKLASTKWLLADPEQTRQERADFFVHRA